MKDIKHYLGKDARKRFKRVGAYSLDLPFPASTSNIATWTAPGGYTVRIEHARIRSIGNAPRGSYVLRTIEGYDAEPVMLVYPTLHSALDYMESAGDYGEGKPWRRKKTKYWRDRASDYYQRQYAAEAIKGLKERQKTMKRKNPRKGTYEEWEASYVPSVVEQAKSTFFRIGNYVLVEPPPHYARTWNMARWQNTKTGQWAVISTLRTDGKYRLSVDGEVIGDYASMKGAAGALRRRDKKKATKNPRKNASHIDHPWRSALRALGEGPRSLEGVAQALGWLDHGPGGIHATKELLGFLAEKGLVSKRSGKWSLTSKGERSYEKVRIRRNPRKISEQAAQALLDGERFKSGNTKVSGSGDKWGLYLHGHKIAEYHADDGVLFITTAGYSTMTTKERLNALPGVSVHTAKGQLHLNGEPWDGDWMEVI